MNVSKAVLITGCSSGIGWATAERLVDVGWRVYATARNVQKIAPLEQRGCKLLLLDVTDEDPYAGFDEAVARATTDNYERDPFSRLGGGPETVAEAIEHAVSARNPRSRYAVTPSAHLFMRLRRLLPDRAWDAALRTTYPQPGR